ncbi:MAG: Cof-type HAD-IIB family hydrolase [Anaerolineae bacterium]|nr:Cof-type HAD-IIB family hydrolase [Anaerolineae bacterium]NUQ03278.1 HAD family phosphatase [Anaerolineae bacterium]
MNATTEQLTLSSAPVETKLIKIEMVAIDLDGTLLNSASQMTSRVEAAVKSAAAQGIRIVIATGKTRKSAMPFLERLGLDALGIFVQGTVTYNSDGSIRHQLTLDDSTARQVITFAEDRGFMVALYSGSRILLRAPHKVFQDSMRHYHEVDSEIVGPLQNQVGSLPINKIITIGDGRATTALRWQLGLQVSTTARMVQAGIPTMLEIIPPGASKGAALKRLASDLRIASAAVMAIGDAENDVEMIQYAGIGVAMGNADDHVKSSADQVVASNDADGVAEALERWVIVKPPSPAADAAEPAKPEAANAPAAEKPVAAPAPAAKPARKAKPAEEKQDKPS